MASFWDRINESDVAGSLARGFDAHRKGQEAARIGWENNEWRRNRAIRDYQRQIAEDDLATNVQLGRQVNNALGVIAENRASLYNTPTGYMNTLNALAPVQEGQSRVLSEDGKTINVVGPDGQIMDSMPNLRGKAAENALIDMSGLNLRQRANTLPEEYKFEAQINAQNARAYLEQQYKLAMLQAGLRGGGRGLGGGMGGAGGAGLGKFAKPSDWSSMMPWMAPAYLGAAGIPLTQNGTPDFSTMTPEQLQIYQQTMGQMLQDFSVGALQGLPALAAGINAYGMNTRRGQVAAQNAAIQEAQRAAAMNATRQGTQAARRLQMEEMARRRAAEERANFGSTSINPFGG